MFPLKQLQCWLDKRRPFLVLSREYIVEHFLRVDTRLFHEIDGVMFTDHFSPHLASLHWLPIDSRIQYKLSSLGYHCLNSTAPDYLPELLRIYKPTPVSYTHLTLPTKLSV